MIDRLFVLDSHIDIPWPQSGDPFGPTQRCVDFPKMVTGSMSAGCFVAYVPQTLCDQAHRADARVRAEAMLRAIGLLERQVGDIEVRVATQVAAILQAVAAGAIVVIPAVENGHALGNDLSAVKQFIDLGARYMTLTHNGHNDLADSAIPRRDLGDTDLRHGGLSEFGRAVIERMNDLGMVVDVSHASKQAMLQAVEFSRTPIVASHSCVRALCDHPRNLDDEQLRQLAASGGVIQITAMPFFLRRGGRPADTGVEVLADHLEYAVRLIGIDHVGISSDFDGGGGIAGWMHAGETANVTASLVRRGFTEPDIRALWGQNFLRLLQFAEDAAASSLMP